MQLTEQQIAVIREYFRHNPVLRAYLFGSFARKSATTESDIDLLVELDYSQKIGLKWIGMRLDLEKMLHRKVDLVSAQAVSEHIRSYIEDEKELIYEKQDRR